MDTLEYIYAAKFHEYEKIIKVGNPADLGKIEKLNLELSDILSKMLSKLGQVKEEAHHIDQYRKDLNNKLVKIQNDYNTLAIKKDSLKTLKGIREHQQATFSGAFFWYSIALFIAICLFVILLVYKGGQKVDAKAPMITNTTTTPPLIR